MTILGAKWPQNAIARWSSVLWRFRPEAPKMVLAVLRCCLHLMRTGRFSTCMLPGRVGLSLCGSVLPDPSGFSALLRLIGYGSLG